ncbi:hypothetical protein [Streptomyces sp. 8N706]|uniref:hypothetical protein n=1 Tax=Streptomyces sp. 8N706 TaxID=3457416 RepID=UPI003FD13888
MSTSTPSVRQSAGQEPAPASSAVSQALEHLVATHPPLAPHAPALRRLAAAVRTGRSLEQWQYTDLAGAFTDSSAYDDPPDPSRRLRRSLELLPSVTVFVPLLVTWSGLAAATHAYQRMLDDTAVRDRRQARGRTFLELWQTGFDGHLQAPLTFGWMALWTLLAICLVIASTVLAAVSRRRHDARVTSAREGARRALIPLLHEAQAVLNQARHASPGRHASDFAELADAMRGTLAETRLAHEVAVEAQRATRDLAQQANELYGQLDASAQALRDATKDFENAAHAVLSSTAEASGAAGRLSGAVDRHLEAVERRIDSAAASLVEQTAEAADHGRQRFTEAAAHTEEQLGAIRERLSETVDALLTASGTVSSSGSGLATALMAAAEEGARHIGETYRLAVAATTVSLTGTMAEVARDTEAVVARGERSTRETVEQYAAVHAECAAREERRHGDVLRRQAEFADRLRESAAVFDTALTRATAALEAVVTEAGARAAAGTASDVVQPGPGSSGTPSGSEGTAYARNAAWPADDGPAGDIHDEGGAS